MLSHQGQTSSLPTGSRTRLFIISLGLFVGLGGTHAIPGWLVQAGGPWPAVIGVMTGVLLLAIISRNLHLDLIPAPAPAEESAARPLTAILGRILMFAAFLSTHAWIGIQITELPAYLFPQFRTGTIVHAAGGLPVFLTPALIGLAFTLLLFLLNFRRTSILTIPQTLLSVIAVLSGLAVIIAAGAKAGLSNLQPIYGRMVPGQQLDMLGGILAQLAAMPFYLLGISVFMLQGRRKPAKQSALLPAALITAGIFCSLLILSASAVTPWPSFVAHRPPEAAALLLDTYRGQTGDVFYGLVLISSLTGLVCIWNGVLYAAIRTPVPKLRRTASIICLLAAVSGPLLGPRFLSLLSRIGSVTFVAGLLLMTLARRSSASSDS